MLTARITAHRGATAAASVVLALTVAGFFGGITPLLDLAAHFRFQYLIAAGILLGFAARYRQVLPATLSAISILGNAMLLYPCFEPIDPVEPTVHSTPSLRLIHANVSTGNRDHDSIIA